MLPFNRVHTIQQLLDGFVASVNHAGITIETENARKIFLSSAIPTKFPVLHAEEAEYPLDVTIAPETSAVAADADTKQDSAFEEILSGKSLQKDILNAAMSIATAPAQAPASEIKVYSNRVHLDLAFLVALCKKDPAYDPDIALTASFPLVSSEPLLRQDDAEWIYYWRRQFHNERQAHQHRHMQKQAAQLAHTDSMKQNDESGLSISSTNAARILGRFLSNYRLQVLDYRPKSAELSAPSR
jgi:hypothetical protein